MIRYRGQGGFAEAICEKAIEYERDRLTGDLNICFFRNNIDHMEGSYSWALKRPEITPTIRLGICTREFRRTGLHTLFHELGHAQGLNHRDAIDYAFTRLHELSGMKYIHNDPSIMNQAVVDRIASDGISSRSPQPIMLEAKKQGQRLVMEVCGPYRHVLPYLDARPDAKIYDAQRKQITQNTTNWDELESVMGCVLVIPMWK